MDMVVGQAAGWAGLGTAAGSVPSASGTCHRRRKDASPWLCYRVTALARSSKETRLHTVTKAEPHMQWVQTPLQAHQRPWSCVGKNLGPNIVLAKHRGGRVQGKEMGYKQLPAAIAESLCEAGGELAL